MFATASNSSFKPASIRNTGRAFGAAAAFALTALIPLQSHASEVDGYRTYSCVVLGDSKACDHTPTQAGVSFEQRVQPGPYAQYLKYLGVDEKTAIAEARNIGESPTEHTVRLTSRQLSAQEIYDRELGRAISPERIEQTLPVASEQPITAPAANESQQSE